MPEDHKLACGTAYYLPSLLSHWTRKTFEFSSENSLRLPKCLCVELLMPDLVCQASEEPSPTIARDSP
jgi:hypothetical protein